MNQVQICTAGCVQRQDCRLAVRKPEESLGREESALGAPDVAYCTFILWFAAAADCRASVVSVSRYITVRCVSSCVWPARPGEAGTQTPAEFRCLLSTRTVLVRPGWSFVSCSHVLKTTSSSNISLWFTLLCVEAECVVSVLPGQLS